MQPAPLGQTGLNVTPLGFGAFKIGRNQKTKYPQQYPLPDDVEAERLLHGVLDAGINYIDTAPAYGLSEERIGRFLHRRRSEFVLSTKVGETFAEGTSHYDFSAAAVCSSIERSLRRLRTDVLDLVFIHSDGNDRFILAETDCVPTLLDWKERGVIRAVGFSGKTVTGAREALRWADVLMVEYHLQDRSHEAVMAAAQARGVGVVVKKGLAAGRIPAAEALRGVLAQTAVNSVVVGGLNPDHIRSNIRIVDSVREAKAGHAAESGRDPGRQVA